MRRKTAPPLESEAQATNDDSGNGDDNAGPRLFDFSEMIRELLFANDDNGLVKICCVLYAGVLEAMLARAAWPTGRVAVANGDSFGVI